MKTFFSILLSLFFTQASTFASEAPCTFYFGGYKTQERPIGKDVFAKRNSIGCQLVDDEKLAKYSLIWGFEQENCGADPEYHFIASRGFEASLHSSDGSISEEVIRHFKTITLHPTCNPQTPVMEYKAKKIVLRLADEILEAETNQ